MQVLDLIAKKRDSLEMTAGEIRWLIKALAHDEIPDYQIAAWLMAVYLNGMSPAETSELTLAMAESGQVMDLSGVKAALQQDAKDLPLVTDKHSTGGVGDKTTITVAPLVAACGVPVGKMSGRGLGHTGGTLDKLESIPGFEVNLSVERFKKQLTAIGIVLAGQTHELAPADGKLYALRDVTATVASIALIASSIMSKKIAAGADAIVLDVKVGSGAFMQDMSNAESLAKTMIAIGRGVGRRVSAVIGPMDQPLGRTVGNALEVLEAAAALRPERQLMNGPLRVTAGPDFVEHCFTVATEMLLLTGKANDYGVARRRLEDAIAEGSALGKFRQWVTAQGGGIGFLDGSAPLAISPHSHVLYATDDGYVTSLDALAVGMSAMRLGAGRAKKGDRIDPSVGIVLHCKVGDLVGHGEQLLTVYGPSPEAAKAEIANLAKTITVSPTAPANSIEGHRVLR